MNSPLLRVADFSTHLSGPLASHILRDLGADVIKIEHPRFGDGNRGEYPFINKVGNLHVGLSAGARSLTASMRSPHWGEIVGAAARWADVVIIGSRPADAARRGLDFPTLTRQNKQLVYCLITGYGLQGPLADHAAHGQNVDAMAGSVDMEMVDGEPMTRLGWRSAGSTLAGVFGALGILGAVTRARAGEGPQFVHTSLWAAAMWWQWRDLNMQVNEDERWLEYRDMGSRYSIYATKDDRQVLVCPVEQKFWLRFCDVIGLEDRHRERGDWAQGMDFGYADERADVATRMRARTLDEWSTLLEQADVPFSPVLTLDEAAKSEHGQLNGVLRDTQVDGKPAKIAAAPVRIGLDEDSVVRSREPLGPPPGLGEHSEDILTELGLHDLLGKDLSR